MRTGSLRVAAIAVLLGVCLWSHSVTAITFNYVGNAYTTFNPNPPSPDIGTSITGSVTFDFLGTPPDANYLIDGPCLLVGGCVTGHVTGVSLHSGSFNASSNPTGFVTITGGVVSNWRILADASCGLFCDVVIKTDSFFDLTDSILVATQFDFRVASNDLNPGAWTTGVEVVPLPAALPLFATGIGALAVLGWRRKRQQAA
jgi:hypothetical protein